LVYNCISSILFILKNIRKGVSCLERIIYNSKSEKYKKPFGALKTDEMCTFNIDILKSECPESATLCVRGDGKVDFSAFPMSAIKETEDYIRFSCDVSFTHPDLYFYRFEFKSPNGTRFCGVRDGKAYIEDWLNEWQLTVYDKDFKTPSWAKNAVMYQIFPDRFCRSTNYMYKPSKNERKIKNDWFSLPESYGNDFFMGNLLGIAERLSYIKDMGADIIYLNPIFESPENHRYSTADYFSVDPYLGENEDFKRLCEKAQKLGIKIILDGVFSHTGADSIYFNKFGNYESVGAYQGKDSPYYSWYNFNESEQGYECWWGFSNLPNVNETNPDYLEFITGKDGVLPYWLKRGASGFRLDVADELPDEFLDALRKRVKETDENSLIIGEVWEDATNKFAYGNRRRYLLGKQVDSVMNYPWRTAIIDYIREKDACLFKERILSIEENYPKPSIDCLMNIISTHDTERIINALGVKHYVDREQAKTYILSEEELKNGIEGTYFALFLLFSLPGIACVYYGDEVGLDGFSDPYCRKGYPYGKENFEILDFVKKLARLRKEYPDSFSSLIKDFKISKDAICFFRGDLLFAINTGENDENIKIEGDFVTIFGDKSLHNMNELLTIPKKYCGILLRKS